jgi:hypothetical protein
MDMPVVRLTSSLFDQGPTMDLSDEAEASRGAAESAEQ